jgi:hypothetical protein
MPYIEPLFDTLISAHYTDIAGITNAKFPQYTKAARHVYKQLLNVFDVFNLEYFLFAGSMVGYVRNKKMPRWMDDLDLIIFEDQIQRFEGEIIPHLQNAGFNCFKPHQFPNAGYHVLSMQTSKHRESGIDYADDIRIRVPWAQIDVFYTRVDKDGFIRNLDGWGLYHQKDIPVDWVKPAKSIRVEGRRINAFRKYRKDIEKQYGDVINNIRISDHKQTFLDLRNTHWSVIDKALDVHNKMHAQALPPSVNTMQLTAYIPNENTQYFAKKSDNFDTIVKAIVDQNAGKVLLREAAHIFWVMDLKRLFPAVHIIVQLQNKIAAQRAAHLYAFIDVVLAEDIELKALFDQYLQYLDIPQKAPQRVSWYKKVLG